VCDDIADEKLLNVGTVVCRNLGATLINITTGVTGPTGGMYICIYIFILTILGVRQSATVSIYSEYFSFSI